MSRRDLQDLIATLRREVDDIEDPDGEARERLTELIAELEARLADQAGDETTARSTQSIDNFIEQFEVEHPRITGILNDIMVTLSNMGI